VRVAVERPDVLLVLDVPDLNAAFECSDAEMVSLLTPRDRCHLVARTKIDKLSDVRSVGVPDVNRLPKGHSECVLLRPINKVKVKVIAQAWGVQDTERVLGNLPLVLEDDVGH